MVNECGPSIELLNDCHEGIYAAVGIERRKLNLLPHVFSKDTGPCTLWAPAELSASRRLTNGKSTPVFF